MKVYWRSLLVCFLIVVACLFSSVIVFAKNASDGSGKVEFFAEREPTFPNRGAKLVETYDTWTTVYTKTLGTSCTIHVTNWANHDTLDIQMFGANNVLVWSQENSVAAQGGIGHYYLGTDVKTVQIKLHGDMWHSAATIEW